MVKCRVKDDWFQRTDALGYKISAWGKKLSETELFCTVCIQSINCEAKGFQAVTQHVSTNKHDQNSKQKLNAFQLRLCSRQQENIDTAGNGNQLQSMLHDQSHQPSLALYSTRDLTTKAEILWALKNVISNMFASSCDGIADVFRAMFPESFPVDFSLGRGKLAYLITEALGPHFQQELINDAQRSYYTLMYDETTNSKMKKELQVTIQYWSESENQVVVRHLETFFLSYATGENLAEHLDRALDNAQLSKNRLLMLGSDGPNVNKKVFRIMNDGIRDTRGKGLLDIGTCNIHIVHNGSTIFDTKNLLLAEKVVVSEDVAASIQCLGEREKFLFLKKAQKHYIAAAKHILEKTSLSSNALSKVKVFRFLQPQNISISKFRDILSVANQLPMKLKHNILQDEWMLLGLEKLKSEKVQRIDHFWRQVFQMKNTFGETKYPNISVVVKSVLSLSHGSAEVERNVSVSSKVLTEENTAMSLRTLNARLHIKNGMQKYHNKPELVNITRKLLISAQCTYQKYRDFLSEEKKQQEKESKEKNEAEAREREAKQREKKLIESRKNLEKVEKELTLARKAEGEKWKAMEKLLDETNERLKVALKRGDLAEAVLAQGMLEGLRSMAKEAWEDETETTNLQKKIDLKKNTLITNFLKD